MKKIIDIPDRLLEEMKEAMSVEKIFNHSEFVRVAIREKVAATLTDDAKERARVRVWQGRERLSD